MKTTPKARTLTLVRTDEMPPMMFRELADGSVEFHYLAERGGGYPGFDSHWMVMTEQDRQQQLLMGGRLAEWLLATENGGRK